MAGPPPPTSAEKLPGDVDRLFEEHSVRDIREYAENLSQQAHAKQQAVRTLVGDRFHDLLSVSRTVVDMSDQLAVLRQTIDMLLSTSSDVARQHASRASEALPLQGEASDVESAAAMLLVADAPETIRSALKSHAFIQAAWSIIFAGKAWTWIKERLDMQQFPMLVSQWADVQALRKYVLTRIDVCMQQAGMHTSYVLDVMLAYILLQHVSLASALSHFHAQRVKAALRTCTEGEYDHADRLQRLLRSVTRTLHHTHELWARPSLSRILSHLSRAFFELGAPRSQNLSFAPVAARDFYAHVPMPVQAYELPPMQETLPESDIYHYNEMFVRRVCSELDSVLSFITTEHRLDSLLPCRDRLKACVQNSPALSILEARLSDILVTQVRHILQQMLSDVPRKFAEALEQGKKDTNAMHDLFTAENVPPTHWRTVRTAGMEACISLVETRLRRIMCSNEDVTASPVHETCMILCDELMQADTSTTEQMHWLLRVCVALYTSPVLTQMLSRTFFERLADIYMELGTRWAHACVQHVVSMDRGAMPSLLMLAHELHTLGPSPLPPPPVWDEWARQTHRAHRASPTQQPMPWQAILEAEDIDTNRVRLILAPWIFTHGQPHQATARRDSPARVARVAPPFISW